MNHRCSILFLMFLVPGCASSTSGPVAENGSSDPAVVQQDAEATPERKVTCRRVATMGSNFTRKVCKTDREMERDLERAREAMEQIRSTTKEN